MLQDISKNIFLEDTVIIHPSLMNNNMEKTILKLLRNKFEKKCYKEIGYIDKITNLIEYDKYPIIPKEDFSSSAHCKVKFVCKLYSVTKNFSIDCEIIYVTDTIIYCKNNAIHVMIKDLSTNISRQNFIYDNSEGLWKHLIDNDFIIKKGNIIIVEITDVKIVYNSDYIICFGIIVDKVENNNN